jgi:hypothetical protein
MRVQILTLLNNYITKKDMKTMKGLLDTLVKLVTDGAVEVREKCVEVLCEMKAVYGLGFFGERLRDVQSQKLQKMMSQKSDIRVVGGEIGGGDFEEGRKKNNVVHTQSLPQLPTMEMYENNSNTSNLNYNKPTTTST